MVSIIVAVAEGGVIGCHNRLIWHISEDLKYFKSVTTGHPVVMGRKTFESIGRPLPNRTNVVVTRQKEFTAEGCRIAHCPEEAIALFPETEEIFFIGGAEIYREVLPLADRLYLTRIETHYQGDAFFPAWNESEWELMDRERHDRGEKFEHPFTFLTYKRKR